MVVQERRAPLSKASIPEADALELQLGEGKGGLWLGHSARLVLVFIVAVVRDEVTVWFRSKEKREGGEGGASLQIHQREAWKVRDGELALSHIAKVGFWKEQG